MFADQSFNFAEKWDSHNHLLCRHVPRDSIPHSLTRARIRGYAPPVAAKSVAGVGLPCSERQGAHSKRFFYARKPIYGGLYGGSSERRSRTGKSNSVQPATLLIGLNTGSSQIKFEDITMTGLIPLAQRFIAGNSTRTVSARKLHEFLGSKRKFADWIRSRIKQYGFTEKLDYILVSQKCETRSTGGTVRKDYYISIDMAKALAMVERTEKGREARTYFIDCENRLIEKLKQEHKQQAMALPVPADVLTKKLRTAINRKAQALSMQGYESIRTRLTDWVRAWAEGGGEDYALNNLEKHTSQAGEMVFVNAETLWKVTANIRGLQIMTEGAVEHIRNLEKETGRKWYGRS